jgi:hypothetical protein
MRRLASLPLVLLMLSLLVSPTASAQSAPYTLAPVAPSVAAGSSLDFVGSGFVRGERVSSWATTPDQRVIGGSFATATGREGRIELAFDVPRDAVGGRWSLTVYGEVSQTPVVTTFEVIATTPDAGETPVITVAPPAGPRGTRFRFFAEGFDESERISYWFSGPDGSIIAYPEDVDATEDGEVYFDWTAPASIVTGTWVITIQGKDSDVVRGIRFEIQ